MITSKFSLKTSPTLITNIWRERIPENKKINYYRYAYCQNYKWQNNFHFFFIIHKNKSPHNKFVISELFCQWYGNPLSYPIKHRIYWLQKHFKVSCCGIQNPIRQISLSNGASYVISSDSTSLYCFLTSNSASFGVKSAYFCNFTNFHQ